MTKYTFLWMLIPVAMAFFLVGVYKNFVSKIAHILWVNDPGAPEQGGREARLRLPFPTRETLFSEAAVQKRIGDRSTFLWVRHLLIFSGFISLFVVSQFYALLTEVYPIDYFVSGTGRGYLKFSLEFTGLVLFVGLTLGLIHRIVYAQREKTLVEFRLLLLLWFITATGFLTETLRLATEPHARFITYSFVAGAVAQIIREYPMDWDAIHSIVWTIHVLTTAFFFGYLPFTRFIHIFAAPLGRSITMGQDTSRLKREKIAEGLL
jgi:nitrate reductase gamma subunit